MDKLHSLEIDISSKPLTLNAHLNLIYTSLLSQFSSDDIRNFWNQFHVIHNGSVINESSLYKHIWNLKSYSSQAFVWTVFNKLESFVNEKGMSILEFWDKAVDNGSIYNPNFFLFILQKVLTDILKKNEPQIAMLKSFPIITKFFENSFLDLLNIRCDNENYYGYYLYWPDKSFSISANPPDQFTTFALISKYVPLRFGYPPVDEIITHSEMQSAISRIDAQLSPCIHNGVFYIDNVRYGHTVSLKNVCSDLNLKIDIKNLPVNTIIKAENDYYCRYKKRYLLEKGCYYGTPFCCSTVRYRKNKCFYNNPIETIAQEILYPEKTVWEKIETRHHQLTSITSDTIILLYNEENSSVYIGDTYITSGTQGRILFRIINDYINLQKSVFDRRILASDWKLVSSMENTGLGVRLNRIIKFLEEKKVGIRIKKIGRGKFKLMVDIPIHIRINKFIPERRLNVAC